MAIKVLINGAKGKMGLIAVKAVESDPMLEIAALTGKEDNLKDAIQNSKAEVVLDLTRASDAFKNASIIIESGAHPVIGTSGLLEEQVRELRILSAGKKLGGIIVPNFAISVILMQKFAKEAVKYLPHAEIIEMHHAAKEDSPSGTAIRTAEMLSEGNKDLSPAKSKELIQSARGASYKGVNIHSLRLPGYNAHQEIILSGLGETLSLRSDVINRDAYIPGICLACREVLNLKELLVGLENLVK